MNQIEIPELQNTTTEMKNSLEGLSSRCELEKERTDKLKGKSIKVIQSAELKEKKRKRNRDLKTGVAPNKHINMEVPRGKEREKGAK